jgi:hypothetical protein
VISDCTINPHLLNKPSTNLSFFQQPNKHLVDTVLSIWTQSVFTSQ